MVRAYHVIFCAYAFWLPNEERGSWSDFVRNYELYAFGEATKVNTRRSLAAQPYDRERARLARLALAYPPVRFTGAQAREIARGFAEQTRKSGYRIHACAIMRDHVHLVIARHHYKIEQVENLLKGAATHRLTELGMHPLGAYRTAEGKLPSPWAVGFYRVYLNNEMEIWDAIDYVEKNPLRAGQRPQRYRFLTPYAP